MSAQKQRARLGGWLAALVIAGSIWPAGAQPTPWWRSFKAMDGLAEAPCASVTVSSRGNVVVRHRRTNAVSRVDGYQASVIELPARAGLRVWEWHTGQLWTPGLGGVYVWQGGHWRWLPVTPPTVPSGNAVTPVGPQTPLRPVRTGRVLVLLPEQLLVLQLGRDEEIEVQQIVTSDALKLGPLYDLVVSRDGSLWISADRGLARARVPARNARPDIEWQTWPAPVELGLSGFQGLSEDGLNHLVMLARRSRDARLVAVEFDGVRWWVGPELPEDTFRTWHGPGHVLWAATSTGLWQRDASTGLWERDETCPAREVYDAAVGAEGTFWLATSDGLLKYSPPLWRRPPWGHDSDPVLALAERGDGTLWMLRPDRVDAWQEGRQETLPLPAESSWDPATRPRLWVVGGRDLLLDAGHGLWLWKDSNRTWQPLQGPGPGPARALGVRADGAVVVRVHAPAPPDAPGPAVWFWLAQGWSAGEPGLSCPTTTAHWEAYWQARNGDQWFAGEGVLVRIRDGREQAFAVGETMDVNRIGALTEGPDGRLYAVTTEQVWSWDEREWTLVWSGSDLLHAVWCSRDGSLWLGSQDGLLRRGPLGWIAHGTEEGLPPGPVYCFWEDQRGRFWAGTAQGLIRWHPEADRDPPRTELNLPEGLRLPEGATLTVGVRARDRWKFTPTARLLYSYRLDAGEWSAPQESTVLMWGDLRPGRHLLQVRAVDRSGNVEPTPAQREFIIQLAWYRDPRLLVSVVAGALGASFFALLAWNRHRQLRRSYAEVERQVAERTRQLEAAYQELLQSQKMKALGTLAAGVAHDFNNLLSIIKGSVQIIEDHLDDPVKVRRRLDRIKTMVEQGTRVVQAMLGFSRSSQEHLSPADLNEVVQDTLALMGERWRDAPRIRFEAGSDLPPVPMIRDLVQQILLNLLFNALEASDENAPVVVRTGCRQDLPAGLALRPAPAGLYGYVAVRDFGCGIPPEHLPRIFEPFFTTKALSSRRGTGLGLTMVYEMAKRLGGGLAVESRPGQGSTFTLLLPVRPPEPPQTGERVNDASTVAGAPAARASGEQTRE
ncbi:ATP-binding protein [Limisphaera sp. VF-2]|uniref:ATP-binding protein n=1 Tax=Limisphaera sp. VF-2 TaxID=3400418 RepID=UPI003C1D4CCD